MRKEIRLVSEAGLIQSKIDRLVGFGVAFVVIWALVCSVAWSSEPSYQEAVELVKAAETDRSKLVDAARSLALLADKANDPHINSLLYWVKKKMTIQEAKRFAALDPHAAQISEAIVNTKVEKTEAANWLRQAEDFALVNSDNLLKAIRYYEVASRFVGTEQSLVAQERSLALIQKVRSTTVVVEKELPARPSHSTYQPPPRAKPGPGLTLLRVTSKTDGWHVFIDGEPAKSDHQAMCITPCDIEIPKGKHVVTLMKFGHKDMSKWVTISLGTNAPVDFSRTRESKGRSRIIHYVQSLKTNCQKQLTPEGVMLSGPGDEKYLTLPQKATVPFRLVAITRNNGGNLRFKIFRGRVIFNWECNASELRICDPRGVKHPHPGAGRAPGNEYLRTDIVVGRNRMTVYLNGEQKGACSGNYAGVSGQVGVGPAFGSVVEVLYIGLSREPATKR